MREPNAVAVAALASTLVAAASAAGLPPQAACAAFDAHVLTLQEDAAAEDADVTALVVSSTDLNAARALCRSGRVEQALDRYRLAEERLPRLQAWLR